MNLLARGVARIVAVLGITVCGSAARADEARPQWMLGANGGSISRDGDTTRGYGSVALTRRLGRSYVRASVTRFASTNNQGGMPSSSTYTIAFLSAGTTFGRWFADGYGALGRQHRRGLDGPPGAAVTEASSGSGVSGFGGDFGRVVALGRTWSLTPSISAQQFRAKVTDLGPPPGPPGTVDDSSRSQTGTTIGGTIRVDHFFGRDRLSSVGLHATRYHATNALAALVSGTLGDGPPGAQQTSSADNWTEFGGNTAVRLRRNFYVDLAVSRTIGVQSGELTTTAAGFRYLF